MKQNQFILIVVMKNKALIDPIEQASYDKQYISWDGPNEYKSNKLSNNSYGTVKIHQMKYFLQSASNAPNSEPRYQSLTITSLALPMEI